jgi:hypothetical protein
MTRRETVQEQLKKLRAGYSAVTGSPFRHFFCPILFSDADVPLCRAHIVNKAFGQYTRRWTVQRSDVDAFFGTGIESDFVTLPDRLNLDAVAVLTDRGLSRRLRPEVLLDGKRVEHYLTDGPVPSNHLELAIDGVASKRRLVLKLEPAQMVAAIEGHWQVRMEQDVGTAAVGSLIKAAHLTLFEMLGYGFALSPGGRFAGRAILGEFFLRYRGTDRPGARAGAKTHFARFAALVRPVAPDSSKSKGTATDRHVLLCQDDGQLPWAMIVFVRTRDLLHAVLLPIFTDERSEDRFLAFLERPAASIETRVAQFWAHRWLVSRYATAIDWPEAGPVSGSALSAPWQLSRSAIIEQSRETPL